MKNLAFLYSGKPNGLVSLQEDCNAIQKLLELHSEWEVVVNKPLESEQQLREDFTNYKDEKIENLLIFYTGHAVSDGIDSETLKVLLVNDEYDAQIFLNSLKTFSKLATRTLLVLDACYSSKFINSAKKNNDSIEIFCSSLEYEKSSSRNDNSNLSYFTHNFCEAIEQLSLEEKEVSCRNIATYINDKNGKQCRYSPPIVVKNSEMLLTKDRILYELLETLKAKFVSYQKMKDRVFTYVDVWDSNYSELIKIGTFVELFSWLLKDKMCLYCLLKEFNIEGGLSLEPYENDCQERKEKASKSQTVTNVILEIRPNIDKNLANCKVRGWLKYSSEKYIPMSIENSIIDFSKKGDFAQKFPQELEKQLSGKNYDNLELNLILHESLFSVDFQSFEITLDESIGSFMEEFTITTSFEFRHSNYDKAIPKITKWRTNSEKYEKNQELKIEPLIYALSKDKPSKLFGKRFSKGSSVLLIADYSLLDDNLSKIIDEGIPHVICPQHNIVACDKETWKDILVKDMKSVASDCMDEAYENEQNLHFIYNSYENVELFQSAINNLANDTDYDYLKEG